MRNWLKKNVGNIQLSNNEMSVLIFKLSTEPIGLRGRNIFVITNTFVGSVSQSFRLSFSESLLLCFDVQ